MRGGDSSGERQTLLKWLDYVANLEAEHRDASTQNSMGDQWLREVRSSPQPWQQGPRNREEAAALLAYWLAAGREGRAGDKFLSDMRQSMAAHVQAETQRRSRRLQQLEKSHLGRRGATPGRWKSSPSSSGGPQQHGAHTDDEEFETEMEEVKTRLTDFKKRTPMAEEAEAPAAAKQAYLRWAATRRVAPSEPSPPVTPASAMPADRRAAALKHQEWSPPVTPVSESRTPITDPEPN